jgi:hypothetical protein
MLTGVAPSDLSLMERGMKPAFPSWRRRVAEAFDMPEAALFAPAKAQAEVAAAL